MASNMYIPIAFKSDPRGLRQAQAQLLRFQKTLKNVALAGAATFTALTAGAVAFGVEALKAADESERVNRSLAQAVKNSEKFGKTAPQIKAVAEQFTAASQALSELIGIDDETINSVKRNWLSVGNISRRGIKGINRLALTAADVAAGTGKNFEDVANAFTKAFGDPKGAIAKLQKAGVVLNQQEKDRYNLLIAQGQEQQALSFLSDRLSKKFAGQAQAFASPLERLKYSWEGFLEQVGGAFLPIAEKNLPMIQSALKKLAVDPNFQKALSDLAEWISTSLPEALTWLRDNMPAIASAMKDFTEAALALQRALFPRAESAAVTARRKVDIVQQELKFNSNRSPYMNYNITINASSVDTSANTGKAIARSLDAYFKQGGTISRYIAKR